MQTQKTLMDYVGKNERTTIIAKLNKKGQGAPSREPVFSEEEKKKMMACACLQEARGAEGRMCGLWI